MGTMFAFSLRSGLCLAAFLAVWKVVLGATTFHRFNRLLLLSLAVLSLTLPLARLRLGAPTPLSNAMTTVGSAITTVETGLATMATDAPQHPATPLTATLPTALYALGVLAVTCWHAASLFRLRRLLRQGERRPCGRGVTLHVMPGAQPPFSFFRHIVIGEADLHEAVGGILQHELAHARNYHSLDVLFANGLTVLQWWNPAAWLLKRELQQLHEFEADADVLAAGADQRSYQLLLIRKAVGESQFAQASHFRQQSLKNRIAMMKREQTRPWQRLRAAAVIPVAALAVVTFAQPEVEHMSRQLEAVQPDLPVLAAAKRTPKTTAPDRPPHEEPGIAPTAAPDAPRDTTDEKTYDVVEEMPVFPGGMQKLMEYLGQQVRYPEEAFSKGIGGRVIVGFVVEKDGTVSDAKVVRSVHPQLDEEALRVVGLMPRWTPGRMNGKPVRVKYVMPVHFQVQEDRKKPEPLIIVDDRKGVNLQELDPANITDITVLKDPEAIEKYGDEGRAGVVIVHTKNAQP